MRIIHWESICVGATGVVAKPVAVRIEVLGGVVRECISAVFEPVVVRIKPTQFVSRESITCVRPAIAVAVNTAEAIFRGVAGDRHASIAAGAPNVVTVAIAVQIRGLCGVKSEFVVVYAEAVVTVAIAIQIVPLRDLVGQIID